MTISTGASLFDRLGGFEGIRTIVDDILRAHESNPVVKTRFENIKDKEIVRQHAFEFFAAGSGGHLAYTGRDMRTTHKGMNVSEQEFLAVVDDIMGVLDDHGIGQQEKQEVLSILFGLKGEIIRI